MSWENDLKTSLRDLDVPEHGPGFWEELELRLSEQPNVGRSRNTQRRRWTMPVVVVAVVAAVLVVLTVALPPSFTSPVLAYSYPQGSHTYDLSYVAATDIEMTEGSFQPGSDVLTEAEGTLTYTVEEDPNSDRKTITINADVTGGNNLDGPIEDIPQVRFVVDSEGELVEALGPRSGEGFPGFVLPEPLPGSGSAGLPFGFGPPFPDHPLHVGDTWSTSGSRSAFRADGPQFTAEHEVAGEETLVGRETLIIRSAYTTPAQDVDDTGNDLVAETVRGPETADVTVWFDPAAGIIVRAELDRTRTSESKFENGQILTSRHTTEINIQLDPAE